MNGAATTRVSLLEALRSGDDTGAAWEEFVRVYGPAVMQWCRVRRLQHEDALDVTQEVLVRFWRAARQFHYDPRGSFRNYLEKVARSAIIRWIDQRGAIPAADSPSILTETPDREDLLDRLSRAYDAELLASAMAAVEKRVKPHTWQAFRLLALEHCSGAEVAAALDMEANAAYVARWKVQRLIRETFDRLSVARDPGLERRGSPLPPSEGSPVLPRQNKALA